MRLGLIWYFIHYLLDDGTQEKVVDTMQTRMELYDFLNYHEFEQTLDKLFANSK